jgi:hypothetical protein
MNILRKNLFLILAILFTIVAILPLFNQGFFPIHDDEQVSRLYELNYALESLHIPPRISQNLGFGYGYPFFNFYPSFIYYVAQVFVFLGFSYIVSIKIMIAIGFILAAIFMYLFSKQYLGNLGGLVAAVLYTYAPYHSVDVYVRGALPEFFSFVFVPAVFWAIFRLSKTQSFGNVVLLGIFGACLMLTHNLVLLMTIPFAAVYFFFTIFKNKNWKSYLISVIIAGILAIFLSAYFWIPAILENKFTMVNLLTKELADYKLHFVSLTQFVNSPWGYGGSILGPMDGFSLEIGKIHLILVAIVIIYFAFNYLKTKKKTGGILVLFIALFALSVFLQSYYSKFIWDNLKALSYIQFPWRFMLFSVFTASFIGGYLLVFKFNQKLKYILSAVIIIACLIFYGQNFKPSKYLNVNDDYYNNINTIRTKISAMAFEYVPTGIATKKSALNTTVVDIDYSEIASATATPLSENITINTLVDKPQYKKFEYRASDPSKIQVNTFSFPGWKVFINSREISYNDKNKLKLITIDVPKGSGIVEVKLTDTTVRKVANILSVIGIVLIIVLLPFYKRKINYEKTK